MASEAKYRDAVLGMMEDLGVLSDRRAERILQVVATMRNELDDAIRAASGAADTWELAHLQRVRGGLDSLAIRTRGRLAAEMLDHADEAARLGFGMQPGALARAGISLSFGEPDTFQVDLAAQYSADLIRSVTDEAITDINQAMLRSVLARDRPMETLRAIQDVLATQPDRTTGRMGSLASQAERVMRTEGLGIVNMANYARMQETAERFPGAMKVWLHGGGGKTPRPYHRDVLNGQIIPMSEDFVVRDGGHTTKAFGPGAPNLPPASRINCTCALGLVLPEFGSWPAALVRARGAQAKLRAAWGET